jgi:hypothetical protein
MESLGCFKVTRLDLQLVPQLNPNSGNSEPQLQISDFRIRKFCEVEVEVEVPSRAFEIDLMSPIYNLPQLHASTYCPQLTLNSPHMSRGFTARQQQTISTSTSTSTTIQRIFSINHHHDSTTMAATTIL